MATPESILFRYRWVTAAIGAAVVLGGVIWLAGRSAPVEPVLVEETAAASQTGEEAGAAEAVPTQTAETLPAEPVVETVDATEPAPVVTAEAPVMEVEPVAEADAAAEPAPAAGDVVSADAEPVAAETVTTDATENEVQADAVEPSADAVSETVTAEEPAATMPEVGVTAAPGSEATAENPQVAPSLDLVRVEPGGAAVVAGRAEPNSQVDITINGETVASAETNDQGEFVAFVETGSEPGAETIQAVSEDDAGADLVSADTVLVLTPEAPEGEDLAPAVVSATEEAVTVLQPGGLAIPDQVSLDSISYDKAGEAILAGRAQPLSEVRVYVDDVYAVSATASDSGAWSTPLNQVAAGRYILRVDEIGPDGAVSSRAETPFQKEYPENIAPYLQMANGKLTVQPGNTLWVMAREIYGSGVQYTQIFQANKDAIRDPDLIFPGQIFDIPEKPAE